MRAQLALTATALLAASVLAGTPTARASAETCQGKAATIVDMDGRVTGTDEDDVIVAGRGRVEALGGDDMVCVQAGKIEGGRGRDSLHAEGTEFGDGLYVHEFENIDAAMGAGDDWVAVYLGRSRGGTGSVRGGAGGTDVIEVYAQRSVEVDLEDRRMTFDSAKGAYRVLEFEGAGGGARRATITGDQEDNRIFGAGCDLTLRGGRGDDRMQVGEKKGRLGTLPCGWPDRRSRLYGQRGSDVLLGYDGDDVLVGGPGEDRANGNSGMDRCVTERKSQCER